MLDDMWTQMVKRADGVLRLPAQSFELGGVPADRADAFLAADPKSQAKHLARFEPFGSNHHVENVRPDLDRNGHQTRPLARPIPVDSEEGQPKAKGWASGYLVLKI
jgi:hypothetical protein